MAYQTWACAHIHAERSLNRNTTSYKIGSFLGGAGVRRRKGRTRRETRPGSLRDEAKGLFEPGVQGSVATPRKSRGRMVRVERLRAQLIFQRSWVQFLTLRQ